MLVTAEHGTAGECARQLLDALNSGSNERVQRALDAVAKLDRVSSSDSQELEFRDLLAGIVEPIDAAAPGFLSAPNLSKHVVVQMLAHVAGACPNRIN